MAVFQEPVYYPDPLRKDCKKTKAYCDEIGELLYNLYQDGFFGEVIIKVHSSSPFQVLVNSSAKTTSQLKQIPRHQRRLKGFNEENGGFNNSS